jgi:hypothetical protein
MSDDQIGREANAERFMALVLANPVNRALLERLPALDLPDSAVVAGCLFQSVLNGITGNDPSHGISDYDLSYCDLTDLSWEAEDRVIRRCAEAFADLGVDVQVRNQARVHLWYEDHFGAPSEPLTSTNDGIDHYLTACSAFGVRPGVDPDEAGGWDIYAPFGFDDLFAMIVKPMTGVHNLPYAYAAKTDRWRQVWPGLTVVPWPSS